MTANLPGNRNPWMKHTGHRALNCGQDSLQDSDELENHREALNVDCFAL